MIFFSFTFFFKLQLKVGNREDICPCNGRWNFNKKVFYSYFVVAILLSTYISIIFFSALCIWIFFLLQKLFTPIKIEKWVAVNFSAKCDACYLAPELINCGRNRGVVGQSQRFTFLFFPLTLHLSWFWFFYFCFSDFWSPIFTNGRRPT